MKIVDGGNDDLLRLLIEKKAEINAASQVQSSALIRHTHFALPCHLNLPIRSISWGWRAE
jgi:hypothetical protein